MNIKTRNIPAMLAVLMLAGGFAVASQPALARGSSSPFRMQGHPQTPAQRAQARNSTHEAAQYRARQRAAKRQQMQQRTDDRAKAGKGRSN